MSVLIKTQFDSGTIVLADGTSPAPLTVTLVADNGDLSISGIMDKLRDVRVYQSRGKVTSVRQGERVFPSFSCSFQLSQFSKATGSTVMDFLIAQTGTAYASRVSVDTTRSDVFLCDVTFTMEGTTYGDGSDHTITLERCHVSFDIAEGDPNTVTLNGTCYGSISGDLDITVDTYA